MSPFELGIVVVIAVLTALAIVLALRRTRRRRRAAEAAAAAATAAAATAAAAIPQLNQADLAHRIVIGEASDADLEAAEAAEATAAAVAFAAAAAELRAASRAGATAATAPVVAGGVRTAGHQVEAPPPPSTRHRLWRDTAAVLLCISVAALGFSIVKPSFTATPGPTGSPATVSVMSTPTPAGTAGPSSSLPPRPGPSPSPSPNPSPTSSPTPSPAVRPTPSPTARPKPQPTPPRTPRRTPKPTPKPPIAVISCSAPVQFSVDCSGFASVNVKSGTTYSWAWGDGTSSTGKTASHTYDSAGTYVVKLTVENPSGARSGDTKSVTVP